MSEPLTSWTRTLNTADALRLLDAATPGQPLADWTERAHAVLPQASRERRTGLIRLVRRHLLDWTAADAVADTRWLALIHRSPPGARADLLYGRYLFDHPWILRAQAELIGPRLAAAEAPLASRDADQIPPADWARFVDAAVAPGTGPAAIKKTRSELLRNLTLLGVLDRAERGDATRARRSRPAAEAFCWLVAHELTRTHRGEANRAWAIHKSRAALLFRPEPAYAEGCLDRAPALGLLRESYLAGEPRLLLEAA